MPRLTSLLPLLCVTASGFQQQNSPADPARDKDVYAIYSLMLSHPQTSHGADNNPRYLIAATTAPGTPREPCVRPPKDRESEFREVLADYERRKATPRELKREISIPKPYVLLNASEVKEFMGSRFSPNPNPQPPNQQFQSVTDLFTLTDVYFNQRQTLALTAISTWCGGLCGVYQWKVFEKLDTGEWVERPRWVACITMS